MGSIRRLITGLALTFGLLAGVLYVPTAALAADCATPYPTPPGAYLCQYIPTLVGWSNDRNQYFVVGTNGHIYDTYQATPGNDNTWTAWRDLGGIGRSSVIINTGRKLNSANPIVYINNYLDWIALKVLGTDGYYHCKAWTSSQDWQPSLTTWAFC